MTVIDVKRPVKPRKKVARPVADVKLPDPPPPPPPAPEPKRVWLERILQFGRRYGVHAPLAVALMMVVTIQGWNITNYPSLSDDEGTYLSQAWAVQQGLGLAHYTYWYDHPPLGWLQMALVSWIPGTLFPDGTAVAYGRLMMPFVTLISATLLYVLARRLELPRPIAVLAVLLFGLSPLAVNLHRQLYLDNLAVMWMLAAFVLALSPKRAMWQHLAAGVMAALSVLSKETMLLAIPGLLIALWYGSHSSTRKFSYVGFFCGLTLVGFLYPLYAFLNGELFPGEGHVSLIGALLFQTAERAGSGSILTAGSGANSLLGSWLFYDAVLIVGGTIAIIQALSVRRLQPVAVAGLAFIIMALRPSGYLPAMYVIQVLPFFAIALAALVWIASKRLVQKPLTTPRRRLGFVVVAVGVAAGLALVLPRWIDGNHRALTASDTSQYGEAKAWMRDNVSDPANTRVVVDDVLWLDLAKSGFDPGKGVIWFYKLDLDPAVALPGGWRDVDYVVTSPIVRQDAAGLPTVAAAIQHSKVVATFGEGDGRLEIRRVEEGGQ